MDHTDAIPLAPHPNLEQYKKRAKDLVKVCKSGDSDALRAWATEWMEALARLQEVTITAQVRERIDRKSSQIEEFAQRSLLRPGDPRPKCTLAGAQFVIARAHGFESWPKLTKHIGALARQMTSVSKFEAAVDAIVAGDTSTLESLLRADPDLVRARSLRRHQATLLHYLSANGVEGYRQETPKNIVNIAELLLAAGAEIDAPHWPEGGYGPGTTLGLVATSVHPDRAGVQEALMKTLLDAGAAVDGIPGAWQPLMAALDNARPAAADLLARRGARMTIVAAAGLGRLDLVKNYFDSEGRFKPDVSYVPVRGVPKEPKAQLGRALVYAGIYGHTSIVEFLFDKGVDPGAQDDSGQTALHMAAHGGHLETVKLLLERKAPLEIKNGYGGTVLGQTLWSATNKAGGWGGNSPDLDYLPIIECLIAAGAEVRPTWSTGIKRIDEVLQRHAGKVE